MPVSSFERLNQENRELALKYCVEGMIVGNYLTTDGVELDEDIKSVHKLGKKIKHV